MKGKRIPRAEALRIANALVAEIKPHVQRYEVTGSLRRQKPDVGDIDIVVLSDLPAHTDLERTDVNGSQRSSGGEAIRTSCSRPDGT